MRVHRRRVIAGAVLTLATVGRVQAKEPVLIAAASDLNFALPRIVEAFRAYSEEYQDSIIQLTFGSSGLLAKQIANGAPFHVFFSADESLPLELARQGFARDVGAIYALGPVALYANEESGLAVDGNLSGLRAALAEGRIRRFAIANPEHAPYGRAAIAALTKAGLDAAIKPFLVLGENASQALQFANLAGADGALLPAALVEAEEARLKGRHVRISDELAPPLRQRVAVMKSVPPAAVALFDFVKTPAARAILKKYGFSEPPAP